MSPIFCQAGQCTIAARFLVGGNATIPPPLGVITGIFLNSADDTAFRRLTQQMSIGSPLVAGVRAAYKMEEFAEIFDPLPLTYKALLKRASEALQVLYKFDIDDLFHSLYTSLSTVMLLTFASSTSIFFA